MGLKLLNVYDHRNRMTPVGRQSDQQTWVPVLLSVCEAEMEEVSNHDHKQQQTRRLLLIPSPLQTNDTEPCGSPQCVARNNRR